MENVFFQRLMPLYGAKTLKQLSNIRVILFGTGGVGSWCAEALVRSGVKNIALVDPDFVVESNVNRQLPANQNTIGLPKVEVLAKHLNELLPSLFVESYVKKYEPGAAKSFSLEKYDVVIDAIDSMHAKVDLIISARNLGIPVFSSLGAAGRIDPTKVRTADIWKSAKCPLGRNLRTNLRKLNFSDNFQVVYSEEPLLAGYLDKSEFKNPVLGSIMTVTATFGMALASLVLNHFRSLNMEK